MFAAWGLGATSLIASAALGAGASGTFNALQSVCGTSVCPTSEQGTVDRGRALQLATNITLGLGIASVLVGGMLLIVGPKLERTPTGAAVNARLDVRWNGLALWGSF
jgi:hypothetical protein